MSGKALTATGNTPTVMTMQHKRSENKRKTQKDG
jgi:hypothetical protein